MKKCDVRHWVTKCGIHESKLVRIKVIEQNNLTISGSDWPFLIREALKETASEQGWQANFMSKPHPKVSIVLVF